MPSRAQDSDSFGGRVKRYARIGAATGGLAAHYAGSRIFGLRLDREDHAAELKAALGRLKGPLMKVAQIMATVPDALPEEYMRELIQLQANAPSMGWPFVKRRMSAELGPDWWAKFRHFDHTASAAASLGQVHRATALNGRKLACKLQYPDMTAVVEADLRQLKVAFNLFKLYDRAIDAGNIHAELGERLREELDYRREARHMALYRHLLRDEADIHVPETVARLSTSRLLTMKWLEGRPLLDLRDDPASRRNRVAVNMFRAWYAPFYGYGVIHGDPHLGNYSARGDGSVNLFDFGCMWVFAPKFVQGVIDLYYGLRDGDRERVVFAYETWGFETLDREVLDVLNIWAGFVYAPLMEDRRRRMEETNALRYGAETAERVHRELRRLGGVKPPREFVLMDRAAIGLGSVFLHLRAEVNWHRLFHGLIADFDVAALAKRQQQALARAKLPPP